MVSHRPKQIQPKARVCHRWFSKYAVLLFPTEGIKGEKQLMKWSKLHWGHYTDIFSILASNNNNNENEEKKVPNSGRWIFSRRGVNKISKWSGVHVVKKRAIQMGNVRPLIPLVLFSINTINKLRPESYNTQCKWTRKVVYFQVLAFPFSVLSIHPELSLFKSRKILFWFHACPNTFNSPSIFIFLFLMHDHC